MTGARHPRDERPRRLGRLGRRLALNVFLLSLAMVAILTAIELRLEYKKDIAMLDESLRQIEVVTVDSLAELLWEVDTHGLQTQLKALLNIPNVDYVALSSPGVINLTLGTPLTQDVLAQQYALTHTEGRNVWPLGTLTIQVSTINILQRTWDRLWITIGSQLLRTFLLSAFVLFLAHHLITRHLRMIAAFARQTRDHTYSQALRLRGRNHAKPDEIDDTVAALNAMWRANAGLYREIAAQKESLFAEKERAQVTLDSIGDAVITTDTKGRIDYLNPAAERLTRWAAAEAIGLPMKRVFKIENQVSRVPVEDPAAVVLRNGIAVRLADNTVLLRRDGSELPIEDSAAPIRNVDGELVGVVLVFHDVSRAHDLAVQLEYQATHDGLTGLANRRLFHDRFDHAVGVAKRNNQRLALLFLDLDRFKNINDSLGHPIGDKLLQQAAIRLLSCLRASDTVCRQGGDEFIVLAEGLESAETIAELAEAIISVLAERFWIDGHELSISASIGISVYPVDGRDIHDLIKNADAAMYLAKTRGRNNFQFFTADISVRAVERLSLENALRNALRVHAFVLYYQPKLSVETGLICGAEALVRWQHPDRGIVLPTEFIPLSEECGLIVPLGKWILREACRQIRAWQDEGIPPLLVSVNLSAAQFTKTGLVQDVADALAETRLDPSWLELELTESMMMHRQQDLEIMQELTQLGVSLSVDDFGTGYSSLSYLKNLPINALKIDQSFVRHMATHADDAAIVQAIVQLGHSLRLGVIAEGVETEEQIDALRRCGCDQMQGFYFSRPVPADEFKALLQKPGVAFS